MEQYWRPEAVLKLMIGLFASMLAGSLIISAYDKFSGGGVSPEDQTAFVTLTVGMLSFHGAILLLAHWFLREHEQTWAKAFGLESPGPARALLLALGVAAVLLPVAWTLGEASARVMQLIHIEPVAQRAVETLRKAVSPWQKLYFGWVAIVMAPIAEEVLFRGILYPSVRQFGWRRAAVWGTSFLFAVTHGNLMTLLPLTILAVALTWLYERTGNLLAPICCHSLFNLVNFVWLLHAANSP
jgi:membrane protease YdiL (CAAX protease family)